ncbi:DNA-3-methyladenine glycosylase 2 family protein [Rhodobacteraceae bacterium NNCM2]|nr:DNA-3-methyladenine glycosylase 2 family protein [Coraliihabitans acroporae]
MTTRLINSHDDIAEGCAWLIAHEPRFGDALAATGPPPLRRKEGGYGALLNAICAQQLSVAAAESVWRRLCVAQADDPAALLAMEDEALRACGLSRPKIKYARALAEARLDYDALATMPEEDAIACLTAVKGIGSWTAEIYLMFSVGRADVFAPGDLALQEASKVLFDLPERPTEKPMRRMAEDWSPWRGVAARLLWAYYRVVKNREGITE